MIYNSVWLVKVGDEWVVLLQRFLLLIFTVPLALFQQYSPLLKAFTSQGLSELTLLLKIQEYCYDNIHFMKAFQKIVVLLYKGKSLTLIQCSSLGNDSMHHNSKFDIQLDNFGAIIIKS